MWWFRNRLTILKFLETIAFWMMCRFLQFQVILGPKVFGILLENIDCTLGSSSTAMSMSVTMYLVLFFGCIVYNITAR